MMINTLVATFALSFDSATLFSFFLKTSNLMDKIAVVITALSLGLWASRHLYIELKKRRVPSLPELVRPVFLLLRKTHPLWGWIILGAASIHALYYFLPLQYVNQRIITGIVAWSILLLLFILGLRFQFILSKKLRKKYVRSPHVLAAAAFIIALGVHIFLRG